MYHSKYSPSSLHRLIQCPAAYKEALPHKEVEKPSVYAEEGTMLHEVAEARTKPNSKNLHTKYDLTSEQSNAVDEAVEYVENTILNYCKNNNIERSNCYEEYEVWVTTPLLPDSGGTVDRLFYCPQTQHLIIFDYKFGMGEIVEALDNPQMLAYGIGAAHKFSQTKVPVLSIDIHIVQPRIENYDSFSCDIFYLEEWAKEVAVKLQKCESVNPPYNPGHKQCRWCPARFHCKDRLQYFLDYNKRVKLFASQTTTNPYSRTCNPS